MHANVLMLLPPYANPDQRRLDAAILPKEVNKPRRHTPFWTCKTCISFPLELLLFILSDRSAGHGDAYERSLYKKGSRDGMRDAKTQFVEFLNL